jgi:hypothetical protein
MEQREPLMTSSAPEIAQDVPPSERGCAEGLDGAPPR